MYLVSLEVKKEKSAGFAFGGSERAAGRVCLRHDGSTTGKRRRSERAQLSSAYGLQGLAVPLSLEACLDGKSFFFHRSWDLNQQPFGYQLSSLTTRPSMLRV